MQPTPGGPRSEGQLDSPDPRLGLLIGPEGYDPAWDDIPSTGPLFFDRRGVAMTLRQWTTGYNDPNYRFLARDTVGDTTVITAWQGLNAGVWEPTLLFGTILCRNGRYSDEEFSASEQAALALHARKVEALRGHQ